MKMMLITEADGKLVAAAPLVAPDPVTGFRASLVPRPEQQAREIDVPDSFSSIATAEEFHDRLCAHLAQEQAKR